LGSFEPEKGNLWQKKGKKNGKKEQKKTKGNAGKLLQNHRKGIDAKGRSVFKIKQ
jgi:hypothetical protein